MRTIGLTGGVGSGKSTVAALLKEAGFYIVDADQTARDIVAPGQPTLMHLVEHFGADILDAQGNLRRKELAARAFSSPERTALLNAVTHPAIEKRTQELFADAQRAGYLCVVWDMPLLVDKHYHRDMDAVIVVHVDVEERVRRLVKYRGFSADDAYARIRAQISDEQRNAAATYLIDNNGTYEQLVAQVDAIIAKEKALVV